MNCSYVGQELELFAKATCWKKYLASWVRPHLGQRVLEVGAGVGATTRILAEGGIFSCWTCLEPDPVLAEIIQKAIGRKELPGCCQVVNGQLSDLPSSELYSSILYIDVLEHIENDREELSQAVSRLVPGGRVVVLSPAFMSLFSSFDAAVGHFRRYRREQLEALRPQGARVVSSHYLDSAGFLASLANKALLRQREITLKQLLFWDRCIIPVSRVLDPLFRTFFGKSVLTVFERTS